ncbi:MAG TPA: hypothetical protein VND96_18195 [Candidatus Micrarchaeaceae archaeon]|nr:hypothetical protein [Candidatus Micrarchaeaceae archaeon]
MATRPSASGAAHSTPRDPIRVVPLRDDARLAPAPTAAPSLTYRGGPLLTAVQIFSFFWGDGWQGQPQAGLVKQITAFFDYVVTSPLIDQLGEYGVAGRNISHGASLGAMPIPGALAASVDDSAIQQLIQQQISTNSAVPQPTPNSLYFVFAPPGVAVSLGGSSSCSTFCGYHSDINGQIFYAVMPYPDCTGCTGSLTALDALTSTTSHELCEAITDPIPGQGWYDDTNGEIGDICAWQTKKLGNYTVQLEWSNHAGRCI